METYEIDDSGRQVKIEVQAGIVGISLSTVSLKKENMFTELFQSDPISNGDIPFTKIDINRKLRSCLILVDTIMDLSNLTPEQRDRAIKSIYLVYTFTGGPNRAKSFEVKPIEIDSTDPTRVIITKIIKMI
jgi:hypothetical protein